MNEKIRKLTTALAAALAEIDDPDDRIDALNEVRRELSEVSPLRHHPADFVEWVRSDEITGNEYNPNKVAPPEFKLLIRSIEADGYTMPIVTFPQDGEPREIVDGFHRRESVLRSKKISTSTFGRVPTTTIRRSQEDISDRMASTIRHNRARGTHDIDLMMEIVGELVQSGMSDQWIMRNIGMDADELLRLKQLSGLAELFKDHDFSMAWE